MTFVTLTILQLNIFVLDLFSISSKLIEWWVIAPTRILLLWGVTDRVGRGESTLGVLILEVVALERVGRSLNEIDYRVDEWRRLY